MILFNAPTLSECLILTQNTLLLETEIIKLAVAALFGAIIGFEREYRSKAAGFRTITLITLGSTLFVILSQKIGAPNNPDRIASNIITGIGFIGAGVIFKDSFSVSGLTTAASIWIAAAIGMAIGNGDFGIAAVTLTLAMIVLALFEQVQDWIDNFHQVRSYRIVFQLNHYDEEKAKLESHINVCRLHFKVKKVLRNVEDVTILYEVAGGSELLNRFSDYLISNGRIKSFDE